MSVLLIDGSILFVTKSYTQLIFFLVKSCVSRKMLRVVVYCGFDSMLSLVNLVHYHFNFKGNFFRERLVISSNISFSI